MKKIATLGCLAALAVAGGTASAQACDGDDAEYRTTKRYSYSYAPAYAPRTYGYTSRRWAYGYAPAYNDDDDDYGYGPYYGYGPTVGVGVYGDFDRRSRRYGYRDGDRFERGERLTQRSDGRRTVMTGGTGREIRRGGAVGGGGAGVPGPAGGR
jgi:hypothetical protein